MTRRLAENPTAPTGAHMPRVRWWWALVIAGGLALLPVLLQLVNTSPKTVPRVTFVNNSRYDIAASVKDGTHGDTMELGTVKAHSSTDVNDVVDQGPLWVFQFSSVGGDAGEVTIGRADLARGQWRITIPDAVIEHITAADEATRPTPSS